MAKKKTVKKVEKEILQEVKNNIRTVKNVSKNEHEKQPKAKINRV